MGQSFGEFQINEKQHVGIDIMVLPMFDENDHVNFAAPWAIVTVAGKVRARDQAIDDVECNDHLSRYCYISIEPTDPSNPAVYYYRHLQVDPYGAYPDLVIKRIVGDAVAVGDRIAKIAWWDSSGFHHLHYEIKNGTAYLNPLAEIIPNPDTDPPHIEDIYFAVDDNDLPNPSADWTQFHPRAGGACTVVSGETDIIVEAGDRDDAGVSLGDLGQLWVYDMRWRACPDADPNCPWQNTRPLDIIPDTWKDSWNEHTRAQFSTRDPWTSSTWYDDPDPDYAIITNYVTGGVSDSGNWDTNAISNGSYSVSVELTDFAGNKTVLNRRACVENSPTPICTTELTIRDNTDDYGAIPYVGRPFWESPDITSNPGTADEDKNILVDADNLIEVRAWNNGSCDLPAGTTYDVCLGWDLPSASVPHPLPASQQVSCTTETIGSGGWAVGTSRTTSITWHPTAAEVPSGLHCLVAWIDKSPDDEVQNTPSVVLDDNRAQQNITFVDAPSPPTPIYTSFWINPQDMMHGRSMAATFRYSRNQPTISRIRLHIPPELVLEEIIGGAVVGGYRGDPPRELCDLESEEAHRLLCEPLEEHDLAGLTRVIGGIDPNGRIVLEGIENVNQPLHLMLEVWSEESVRPGEFADIEIVEHGILEGYEVAIPVGGLTIKIEH